MPSQESHSSARLDHAAKPAPPLAMPAEDILATTAGSGASLLDWEQVSGEIAEAIDSRDFDTAWAITERTLTALRAEAEPRQHCLCAMTATAGEIQEARNYDAEAAALFRQALEIAEAPDYADPSVAPELHFSLSLNLLRQSGGLKSENRTEAERHLKKVLDLTARLYNSSPDDFESVPASDHAELVHDAKLLAVEALQDFSEACSDFKLKKRAEHYGQRACSLCEKILGPEHPIAFKTRWTLMNAAHELRRYEHETHVIQRSLTLFPTDQREGNPGYLILEARLAICHALEKRFDQAHALAYSVAEKLEALELDELGKSTGAFAHQTLGRVAAQRKQWQTSIEHYERAIRYEESRDSVTIGFLNGLRFSLATAIIRKAALAGSPERIERQEAAAEKVLKEACALTDQPSLGPTEYGVRAHRKLLDFYLDRDRLKEAEAQAVILQDICKLVYGSESPGYVNSFQWRSDVLALMGNYGRAEALTHKALEIAKRMPDEFQDSIPNIYKALADLSGESGADKAALDYLREGLDFAIKLRGPRSFLAAQAGLNLADELLLCQETDEAARLAGNARENLERFPPAGSIPHELGRAYSVLAECLCTEEDMQRADEAEDFYKKAEANFIAARSEKTPAYGYFLRDYGMFLARRFDIYRKPEYGTEALTKLRTGEGLIRELGLHVSQMHFEAVERIVELLQGRGEGDSASMYEELRDQLRAELDEDSENAGDDEDEI